MKLLLLAGCVYVCAHRRGAFLRGSCRFNPLGLDVYAFLFRMKQKAYCLRREQWKTLLFIYNSERNYDNMTQSVDHDWPRC